MRLTFGVGSLSIVQGDIVCQPVEAIVNAANRELAGGGGVDGAIHRAAGPAVLQETARRYPFGCPPGDAVATAAGNLPRPIRLIFHTVGPIWQGGQSGEADVLRSAHRRCLELAVQHEVKSIAFPAISTGVYRYPVDLAAMVALHEAASFLIETSYALDIRFVLFDAGRLAAFARVLETMVA